MQGCLLEEGLENCRCPFLRPLAASLCILVDFMTLPLPGAWGVGGEGLLSLLVPPAESQDPVNEVPSGVQDTQSIFFLSLCP